MIGAYIHIMFVAFLFTNRWSLCRHASDKGGVTNDLSFR